MTPLTTLSRRIALVVLGLLPCGAVAYGPTWATKDEAKCQQAVGKSLGKEVAAHAKCIAKCAAGFAGGRIASFGECAPPYGGATAVCVERVLAKSMAGIVARCADDATGKASCPTCYGGPGADCRLPGGFGAWGQGAYGPVQGARAVLESWVFLGVFCGDVTTDTAAQATCRQAAMMGIGKLWGALDKCTARCRDAQWKGKSPANDAMGVCTSTGASFPPTDAATAACFAKAIAKFQSGYAAACGAANEQAPSCAPMTAEARANFIAAVADQFDWWTFCGR